MGKYKGFTLVEVLVIVAVVAILAAVALPSYFDYVRKGRLYDAQRVMLNNAKFLEQFYSRKFSFKQNSTTWAAFPEDEKFTTGSKTKYFCIKMQGNPRGAAADRYTMKAVAKDKKAEPRSIILNEDHQFLICETSTSTCDEKGYFVGSYGRTDKNCRFL